MAPTHEVSSSDIIFLNCHFSINPQSASYGPLGKSNLNFKAELVGFAPQAACYTTFAALANEQQNHIILDKTLSYPPLGQARCGIGIKESVWK